MSKIMSAKGEGAYFRKCPKCKGSGFYLSHLNKANYCKWCHGAGYDPRWGLSEDRKRRTSEKKKTSKETKSTGS
jgi:DnaJ-class molecular chaperone